MTESKLTIRPIGSLDSTILASMMVSVFEGEQDVFAGEAWSRDSLANLISMPGFLGYFATLDKDPAGFLLCRVAGEEAEVLTLGVVPPARRRGVARALFAAFGRDAADRGVEWLFLEVAENNAAARRFYAEMDWIEAGRRDGYYKDKNGKTENALVLVCKLKN